MAGKKKNQKPTAFLLTVKTLIAVALGVFFVMIALAEVAVIAEDSVDYREDVAAMVDSCNRYYYARQYGNLRDELTSFDLYSEDFDKYWEICNGYEIYLRCLEYASLDGGEAKKAEYETKLSAMVSDCKYEENARYLSKLADSLHD